MDLINLVTISTFVPEPQKQQNDKFTVPKCVIFIQLELWKITEKWEKWNKVYAYIELKLVKNH